MQNIVIEDNTVTGSTNGIDLLVDVKITGQRLEGALVVIEGCVIEIGPNAAIPRRLVLKRCDVYLQGDLRAHFSDEIHLYDCHVRANGFAFCPDTCENSFIQA